jgi:hypothetical protein
MQSIKVLDVSERLIDELWNIVSKSGSFYSIADGVTKGTFEQAMFKSDFVLSVPGGYMHLNIERDYVELHPIATGKEAFREAKSTLKGIYALLGNLFQSKPICCIIPSEMESAKRLAAFAGMTDSGPIARVLSGVNLECAMFIWRPRNVQP